MKHHTSDYRKTIMIHRKTIFASFLTCILFLLTACGTFEVGLERASRSDITPVIPTPTMTVEPTEEVIESTPTPYNEDELFIRGALVDRLGVAVENLQFTITQNTGAHAMGIVSNDYFIAAKDLGSWVILYDGQGTPYCLDVEPFQVPIEMVPECLDVNNNLVVRSGNFISSEINLLSLECGVGSWGASSGTVEYVACNIQDGLRSRNISTLPGYMADPFMFGYHRSEGMLYTPTEMLEQLPELYNFYAVNYSPRLTFTTDRGLFPDLEGIPIDSILGPDVEIVLVIYSQGWGFDGLGGSLLFFTQDEDGNYHWYGMLHSPDDFSP
jgi:hypothetical protein